MAIGMSQQRRWKTLTGIILTTTLKYGASDKYIQWQFNCRHCLLDLTEGCCLNRVPDSLANALYFHSCSSRETERTSCQKIRHDSNVLRRLPFFVGNLGADLTL